MDVLRDALWQFIGAAVAIAALLATVLIALYQRDRRRLVYRISEFLPLVSIHQDQLKDRLQILFDGRAVQNAYLIVLHVANAGNRPIKPADFVKPLRFNFGVTAQVLDARVVAEVPSNLDVKLSAQATDVIIEPLLLNRRDRFVVRAFVTAPEFVVPDARIVGTEVVTETRRRRSQFGAVLFGATVGGALLVLSQYGAAASRTPLLLWHAMEIIGVAFVVAGIATVLYEWNAHVRQATGPEHIKNLE